MGKAAVRERPKSAAPETNGHAPAENGAVAVQTGGCVHHWLIDTPRGSMSSGRCKRCGEVREFRNSATDYIWDDDSSSGYHSWGGMRSAPKAASDDEDGIAAAPSSAATAIAV